MISVGEFADAAIRIKERSEKHIGWRLAAIKAIESKGIRFTRGAESRKEQILDELHKRGIIPALRRRRYAVSR